MEAVLEQGFAPSGCLTKVSYESELEAREVGAYCMTQRPDDLYVYPCAYCQGWHLTRKARAAYWHVATPTANLDDYADLLADEHFWKRLVDMPHLQAEAILRRKKQWVHEAYEDSWHPERQRIQLLIGRLKDEIHLVSRDANKDQWKTAIKNVVGAEALEAVLVEIARIRAESDLQTADSC